MILGGIALVIACVGLYVGAIKLLVDSRHDLSGERGRDNRDVAQEGDPAPPPLNFSPSDYRQNRFPRPTDRPVIGVNYTHHAFENCSLDGTGILRTYSNPGIAQKVHGQLFQMRRAGLATIRTIIWHMTDATGQLWGPIPSAGGRLQEPYRTNLIRYLMELKRYRFTRFTVSFAPQGTNNPRLPKYEPDKFAENWQFIRSVRSLVKRYGPRDAKFDLMNEGAPSEAPSEFFPVPQQVSDYLRAMYRLYVNRFGNRDVRVSVISPPRPADRTNRLQNLVRILRSTNQPLPRRYEVHIGYDAASALHGLRNADRVLNQRQQHQPLVIGETAYDNPGVAQAIERFLRSSSRQIDEVSPWYQRMPRGCQVTPPYTTGTYGRELHPRPVP